MFRVSYNKMKKIIEILTKIYNTIGTMKYAVASIVLFAAIMIVGTIVESIHGSEYAQSLIYLSWWFILLQFSLYLSILIATLNRIPFKKRLTGFYIIHTGLLTLFTGSMITYTGGIDGSMTLLPMDNTNRIDLNDYVIKVKDVTNDQIKYFNIPKTYNTTKLDYKYKNFSFDKYIPYSGEKVEWVKDTKIPKDYYALKFELISPFMNKDFTFVKNLNDPKFTSFMNLGPLSIRLVDSDFFNCLKQIKKSELLVHVLKTNKCIPLEKLKYKKRKSSLKNTIYDITYKGKVYSFFPKFNAFPINKHMSLDSTSPIKIIKPKGSNIVYLNKLDALINNKGEMEIAKFTDNKLELPWMGMYFTLKKYTETELPIHVPFYESPIQKNGNLIKGQNKAVTFTYNGIKKYLTNMTPKELGKFVVTLEKKAVYLPFDVTLRFFQMNKNPGTSQPTSFESFINVFENGNTKKEHVYINNPLKKDKYTFYQASYFDMGNGQTASVLSVNYDPGRWLKYLGSLLLVIGAFLHFFYFSIPKSKRFKFKNI